MSTQQPKQYFTERSLPLVTFQVSEVPVITLECYDKHYVAYVLYPNGDVKAIGAEHWDTIEQEDVLYRNHVFHPQFLYRAAWLFNGVVDPVAIMLAAGMWECRNNEKADYGDPAANYIVKGWHSDAASLPQSGERGTAYEVGAKLYAWINDQWCDVTKVEM